MLSDKELHKSYVIALFAFAVAVTIVSNYFLLDSIPQLRTSYKNAVVQREWMEYVRTTPFVWIKYSALFKAILVTLFGLLSTAIYFAPINRACQRNTIRYILGVTVAAGAPMLIYLIATWIINNTGAMGGCPVAFILSVLNQQARVVCG